MVSPAHEPSVAIAGTVVVPPLKGAPFRPRPLVVPPVHVGRVPAAATLAYVKQQPTTNVLHCAT